MPYLILLRHGESLWNLENRFTGWIDIDLSERGVEEATHAGRLLKNHPVDVLFTSALKRAIRTADIVCGEMGIDAVPVFRNEALNERHYGDLQGLNKAETAARFGDDQVHVWRRSYDVPPPNGESLKDTQERVLPYFNAHIKPQLAHGKNVLVVAHGNSLRALVMNLESMSPEEILATNIPTGVPLLYKLDNELKVLEKQILQGDHE